MLFADFLVVFLAELLLDDFLLLLLLFLLLFDDEVLLLLLLALLLLFAVPVSLPELAMTGMVEQRKTAVIRARNIYTICRRTIFFSYQKSSVQTIIASPGNDGRGCQQKTIPEGEKADK
jgi:hypothetical protein